MKLYIKKKSLNYTWIFTFFALVCFIFLWALSGKGNANSNDIFLLSWIANIIFIISFWLMYKVLDNEVGLQHIVILICFLFNFGQTCMWSLGIHANNEIGKIKLYSNYKIPSDVEIYNAIIYSEYCFLALLLGIFLFTNFTRKERNAYSDSDRLCSVLYKVSFYLSWVIIPLTFAKVLMTLFFSAQNGYTALYYSTFQIATVLDFAERLFFPVLVGLLLGSNYKKVKFVYIIFLLFVVLYSLAGERGNWIYDLLVLFWMHNKYYKKIDLKKLLKIVIVGFIALYIIAVIVDLRQYGLMNISISEISDALKFGNNPVVRFVMEMGQSLGVTIIVLNVGKGVFPISNSFVTSLLGSVSTKLANLVGMPVIYLSNYLSQDVLKIGYGAGFNFFAESYVNGSVFYMLLWGGRSCDIFVRIQKEVWHF